MHFLRLNYWIWQQKRHYRKRRNVRITYKFTCLLVRIRHTINSYMIFKMVRTLYFVISAFLSHAMDIPTYY